MSRRTASWIAGLLSALAAAFGVLCLLLLVLNREVHVYEYWLADAIIAIVFPAAGALIISRYPGNALGWVFCIMGVSSGAGRFASEYATYTLLTEPGALPGGVMMVWVAHWAGYPGFLSFLLIPLLFPNGQLPSRRWRPIAWLIVGMIMTMTVKGAVWPGPLENYPSVNNPFGIERARAILELAWTILDSLAVPTVLASTLSLVLRFRRSRGEERQQLKWFTYATILVPISLIANGLFPELAWLIGGISVSFIPISIGIAILKYHLYDIDVIINRTLVYSALTVLLTGVFVSLVAVSQRVVQVFTGQQESQLAIVASTLAIAALFNPLRRRIQVFIDRRFYRRKYDAAKTLEAFSAKLRDEVELERLTDDLLAVVQETLQPAHVSLWLREPGRKT